MPSSPPPAGSPAREPGSRKGAAIGILVGVTALLAGWLSQFAVDGGGGNGASGSGVQAGQREASGSPALRKLARRDADDGMAKGNPDAPVVLIEYADFGCTFCGKFARDTEPKLVEKYVEKGVLRIEWRNLPVFGKTSRQAALASWAAGEQGRFWQFHDAVFAEEGGGKDFGPARLRHLAKQAGVADLARWNRDRSGEAAQRALTRDEREGYGLGANSTPVFLINGEPIAGAQPQEVFTEAIEHAAKAAKDRGKPKGTSDDEREAKDGDKTKDQENRADSPDQDRP